MGSHFIRILEAVLIYRILAIAIAFSILGCVEPTYSALGNEVYCDTECPTQHEMRVALTSQKAMWGAAGYPFPKTSIYFPDRDLFGGRVAGMLDRGGNITVFRAGLPHWESVIDHEMGMIVFDAYEIGESNAINQRKRLGICYPGGDTGYCHE